MKISRSAIIIVIAIALILIAVFAMHSQNPDTPQINNASADNPSYSGNVSDIIITENNDDLVDSNPITDVLLANATALMEADSSQKTEISGVVKAQSPEVATASHSMPAGNSTLPALPKLENQIQTVPEASEQEDAIQPGAGGNATSPDLEDENIVLLPDSPVVQGGFYSLAAIKSILKEKAEAVLKAIEAEKERLTQLALAKEAEKAAREKAEREKREQAELAAKKKAEKEKAEREKLAREKAEKEKQRQAQLKEQAKPKAESSQSSAVAVAPTTPTPPASAGGAPSDVMSKLVAFGNKRVNLINKTIHPNKHSREVVREGDQYVARYYFVEPGSLSVEATPAGQGSPFKYVGKVRYQERLYEIRAASRDEAMKGEGKVVKQRNMCELIQYKNNKWLE